LQSSNIIYTIRKKISIKPGGVIAARGTMQGSVLAINDLDPSTLMVGRRRGSSYIVFEVADILAILEVHHRIREPTPQPHLDAVLGNKSISE
jgi:hypothetical protein